MSIGAIPGLIGAGKRMAGPSSIASGDSRANAVLENATRAPRNGPRGYGPAPQAVGGQENDAGYIGVDSQTGVYVIRVLDAQTEELIREVPPREVLNCISRILQYAVILIDRTA